MKRLLSLLLAMLLLSPALIACGKDDTPPAITDDIGTTTPAQTTETEDPTLRKNAKDDLPADFTMEGKTVGVSTRPSHRLMDWDGGGEDSSDALYSAMYHRTRAVEDRLKVTFRVQEQPDKWDTAANAIKQEVLAGDDTWQIVVMAAGAFGQDYLFQNMAGTQYLDFEKPWWNKTAMEDLSVDGKRVRYLMGDIAPGTYLFTPVMFFNARLYQNNFGDINELYKMAIDRTWTYDKLREMVEKGYDDANGDGTLAQDEVHGFIVDNSRLITYMGFSTGFKHYHRGEDGIYVIEYDQDRAMDTLTGINALIHETPGAVYDAARYHAVPTTQTFTNGHSLFYVAVLSSVTRENFRNMQDDYGILPMPLLDEKQADYVSLISDDSNYIAVPVSCGNPDEISGVLEALASEGYRSVTETVYEIALKMKYSRDAYTGQVIDIIRDTSTTNFVHQYAGTIGCGTLIRDLVGENSSAFASAYMAQSAAANRKLISMVEEYNKLESEMNQ